jgi:iron complex outermembrane recepter protein
MLSKQENSRIRAVVALTLLAAAANVVQAAAPADASAPADAAPADSGESSSITEVIVTGTRQSGMLAAESPAPIQIISPAALKAASGNPDLMTTLAQIVPSLTMQAFGADMAGQTLQVKLRGLSPNDVLILINGKRRHTTSNLAVDNGSPYQGGANVDLNFIPLDAIDHIEVLTDGAAAQYGTDAIAGVINIILKKNSSGGVLNGTYGRYFGGGGTTSDVSGNAGAEPTEGGYFNVTADVRNHGHSDMGGIDERVIDPANLATYPNSNEPNAAGYPFLNMIDGDAETHLKIAEFNSGFVLPAGVELYAFGTYGDKHSQSYENYRQPSKVSYTDAAGVTTYPFPYGFNPLEANYETDYSLTGGIKGSVADWNWDVGTVYGSDKGNLYTLNSANAGTYGENGIPTPSNYYDGTLKTTQWTTTADFNRNFDVGMAGPLNLAFGAEYRRETYGITAGTPLSYEVGGAQSYPGFSPTDAGINDRKNYAGYIDLAGNPIEGLRIDLAGRHEHYSDFGNATVGKLTARYDVAPEFGLRGTVSNGFRAPTLAEEFYSSTNVGPVTAFVQLPPNSAGGKQLGLGNGLQPEKSINYSFGMVWRPIPQMISTLDLYQITITNRIVGSGQIVGSDKGAVISQAVNNAIALNGNQLDPNVVATGETGINVFANGMDTRTRGADLTFDFPQDYAFGHVDWTVGGAWNYTVVTGIKPPPASLGGQTLFDAEAISDVTTVNPRFKLSFGALWNYEKLTVNLQETIYGPSSEWDNDDFDNGAPGPFPACPTAGVVCNTAGLQYFKTTIPTTPITNIDFKYQFTEHVALSIGALNAFNRLPPHFNATLLAHEDNFAYGDNAGVIQYPSFSPFGIDGGFYYAKASITF